jgi:PHP family Zn ribbon phosphoesterase
MNRVRKLADRKLGKKRIPFQRLIPLAEIIADVLGLGVGTKGVEEYYRNLIKAFGSEFKILLNVKKEEIASVSLPEIAEGVERVRQGKVIIKPGYDGEFGKISVFGDDKKRPKTIGGQEVLFK